MHGEQWERPPASTVDERGTGGVRPGAPVTVRPLGSADWPALWPMLRDMGVTDEPPEAHRARYLYLLADPRWVILGAEAGGDLLGYAAAQDHGPHLRGGDEHRTARLHDLYVRPELRRGGVGRSLLAAVREWAATRVRHLEWQAHHERAAPFYERLGHRGDPCPQPDHPTFQIHFHPPS
ncbi:GNAT family N-acetyltransferase [Micromonospora sp. A200]|uniref:GNAT family N-acetyltransferase n=1 Tax=Micromonospora sp. A200 TaxID=2940568 RepID=UPI0024739DAA|nr:GNAT family N-acetyltransferase [Micromonospora sp. A200]